MLHASTYPDKTPHRSHGISKHSLSYVLHLFLCLSLLPSALYYLHAFPSHISLLKVKHFSSFPPPHVYSFPSFPFGIRFCISYLLWAFSYAWVRRVGNVAFFNVHFAGWVYEALFRVGLFFFFLYFCKTLM